MAITRDDVLHIASLARIKLEAGRVDALARELSSILAHVEVLSALDTSDVKPADVTGAAGTPLRPDTSAPGNLSRPLASFAPDTKDGFLIVPRLATHEDTAESGA